METQPPALCVDPNEPRAETPDIDLIRPEQVKWKPRICLEDHHTVDPRVWDFGGQLIKHGVHEQFLTDDERTVYVLVLSADKFLQRAVNLVRVG